MLGFIIILGFVVKVNKIERGKKQLYFFSRTSKQNGFLQSHLGSNVSMENGFIFLCFTNVIIYDLQKTHSPNPRTNDILHWRNI